MCITRKSLSNFYHHCPSIISNHLSDKPLATRVDSRNKRKKPVRRLVFCLFSSGGRTRTSGLRVMSPTSYQLLYPAVLLDYKGKHYFLYCKLLLTFFSIIFNFHLMRPAATKNPRGFPDNISTCRLRLRPRIHEAFTTILRPFDSDCDQKSTKLSRPYSDLSA